VRHVVAPAVRAQLLAVALLLTGAALGTFDAILILTGGGPPNETVTPALFSYLQAYQFSNWPIGSTAAWVTTLLVAFAALAYLLIASRTPVNRTTAATRS
jgi:ABC-type sugar transport system permease subunit